MKYPARTKKYVIVASIKEDFDKPAIIRKIKNV